ncbi:MAG TPA: hypothetical protein VFW62_02535 [bacterium]|nr:hypothetical protein [bacterium]
MFGKRFIAITVLAGAFLGAPQVWGVVVEDEVVFSQVSRVAKKYDNCINNGNTYTFEVTGLVDGHEKTIKLPHIWPQRPDADGSRAEDDMVAFCEKAALLTKSRPDKHDFYMQVKYEFTGSASENEVGLCTMTTGSGRVRGTQLVCELK